MINLNNINNNISLKKILKENKSTLIINNKILVNNIMIIK